MDYDYLEMSILFHHLLHQVYLQLNISDDTFLLMHKLMLSQILSFIPISFDEDIKKRPKATNEMAWLENIPTGSSSQKILQGAAVIKIQVRICPSLKNKMKIQVNICPSIKNKIEIQVKLCPLSKKRNKNPGQDLSLLPQKK